MPIPLRSDFDASELRAFARKTKNAPQARRLLALAAIYEGASRTEAARMGGVTLQIVRDWVVKFNAHGPDGLIDRKPPGQPSRLTQEHRAALAAIIESGPLPAVHGVVRWRLVDLIQWLWDELQVPISKQTLSHEVRALSYRKLSARPQHHAKNEQAVSVFKKISPVHHPSHERTPKGDPQAVAPGAHAVLLLDQAGWHVSRKLQVPANITLLPLPAKAPELNPVENIWQSMRETWLSNRIFTSYSDILDHCCKVWNKLADQPWTIMSVGLRDWAHQFRSLGLGMNYTLR